MKDLVQNFKNKIKLKKKQQQHRMILKHDAAQKAETHVWQNQLNIVK